MTTSISRTRRIARSAALSFSAVALAAATVVGVSGGPTVAQADPGDTFVAIGSSQLVTSEDLSTIEFAMKTQTVTVNNDRDFSSCLGEDNPWSSVIPGTKPITGDWTNKARTKGVSETIAQAESPAEAKRFARRLIKVEIKDCQYAPQTFDFYYGRISTSKVGDGYASWATAYRGDGTPDGGVVVIRKGSNFGLVGVSATGGSLDQLMESVAKVSVDRLVMSS